MQNRKDLRKIRTNAIRRSIGGSGEVPWVKTFRDFNKCVAELLGSEVTMMIMFYSRLPPDELVAMIDKTTVSKLIRLLKIEEAGNPNPAFSVARNRTYEFPYVDEFVTKLDATYSVLAPNAPEEPKNP